MAQDTTEKKEWSANFIYTQHPSLKKLENLEKQYLLSVERGDVERVTRLLDMVTKDPSIQLCINCRDPVGRTAILMAIDNENLEMLELLLNGGVESRDALLHAINAEYVEAVDLLLEHEEVVHQEGEPHSWEKVDRDISTFTPEISPLHLAAHKDNYEILKIILDRGATLPMPHDVRCCCGDCVKAMDEDCLRHSRSRINSYRALSSPSLISLSSIDPILTAFELSWELRRLSFSENEFKQDYVKLRCRCQDFATALLDHARSSRELEMVLNYDPNRPLYQHGDHMPLTRLEMAIKYKQKKFIAHPNVQQLLSTLWYDGLPGFRKQHPIFQLWDITKIGVLFPYYSILYMLFPNTKSGKLVRKPFFKFIIHSFSYLFFLLLLILASQRVEALISEWFGSEEMQINSKEALKRQRGQLPTILETAILFYIIAHIGQETRELWKKGLFLYFQNLWNIIDFTRNSLYVGTAGMRVLAYFQARAEISANPMAVYIPREAWNAYDPMLIADGLFAAGNIFAALKLIHIFSINPYLGPLQISLGRMVIDIIKFFFIYALVLFAFACGLNQLLWYYADMEKQQCFSGPGGIENWTTQRDACLAWRRFSNLFESTQTLFWASFGLVDISNFELTGIKSYTRFWGLLMFGSYSVINVVVLLNLLIAMMSNSYNIISERADVEWKFARTTLFMNYFEEGNTVPPPFNIFPTFKHLLKLCGKKSFFKNMSIKRQETEIQERDAVYQRVMCNLVWRYVTAQQKETETHPVTEDNINELRQDIYSFRHDLLRVFKSNGMKITDIEKDKVDVTGKRVQIRKRRLIKDFTIGLMEVCTEEAAPEVVSNKSMLARLVGFSGSETRTSQRWRDLIQAAKKSKTVRNKDVESGRFGSIKKRMEEEKRGSSIKCKEYQINELTDTKNQYSGNDSYSTGPKNINDAEQKTQVMNTSPNPIPKSFILSEVNETSQNQNYNLQNTLPTEVKLSPNTLIKHQIIKPKYQAPRPESTMQSKYSDSKGGSYNVSVSNCSTLSNEFNTAASEELCSISVISENMPNTSLQYKKRGECKDTTITVTSSPEKTKSMNISASIEMNQPKTPEFNDFKAIEDATYLTEIKAVKTDEINEKTKHQLNVFTDTKTATFEKSDMETYCGQSPYQSEMKENVHFDQYKNETQKNVNDSASPLLHQKKG